MGTAAQRRSDRVSLTLLLEASGKDLNDQEFAQPARTMQINRTGAVILLDRDLRPDQHILIKRLAPAEKHRQSQVRIVGQFGHQKEGYVYGGLVNSKKSDGYTTATVSKAEALQEHTKGKSSKGDHLVVLGGIKDGKYKVQLANGKIAYVDKDAIDVKVDAPDFVP